MIRMAKIDSSMSIFDRKKSSDHPSLPEPAYYSLQISEARRFHFRIDRRIAPLQVVGGGVERCSADYRVKRENFPYTAIEFVARGSGSVLLNRREHKLVPGILFCYDKRIAHDIRSDPSDPLIKYFVDLRGTETKGLLQTAALKPGEALHTVSPQSILTIFDELIRSGLESSQFSELACASLFRVLIYRIAGTRLTAPAKSTPAFETYLHCRRELYRSAVKISSVQALAERCGVDEAYLCRIFKRFDTDSPYQLLRRLKMEYAARRLAEPGVLVKEVAHETGFADAFTFSKSFRQTIGRSPSEMTRSSSEK